MSSCGAKRSSATTSTSSASLLGELFAAADLVLVTGGLGPTADDLTRQAVAAALGRGLTESPEIVADIEAKFASFGMRMPEVNRRQAEVIDGAVVLANRRGTAPGLRVDHERGTLFLFPGVPHELEAMVDSALVPWLEGHGGRRPREMRLLKVACLPESTAEEMLAPAYEEFGAEAIARARVGGRAAGPADRPRRRRRARRAGSPGSAGRGAARRSGLLPPAGGVARVRGGRPAGAAGRTVATAESCTGGLVAERLTRVAGSSAWFVGSAVTYADRLKVALLGVDDGLIERHGAVSREVAEAMAEGVRRRLASDFGLAITGIAGPGGGSEEKPVGTVHVALAGPGGEPPAHRRLRLPGDRGRVRQLTSQWALDLLRRRLLAGAGDAGPE